MPARRIRPQNKLIISIVILGLILLINYFRSHQDKSPGESKPSGPTVVGLPEMAEKPVPKQITWKDCPPEGDGGDPELNLLKNRVDDGEYVPVKFDAIASLTWPRTLERRDRKNWTDEDRKVVNRYEGIPIAVEGFLADIKESGPESPNCHGADHEFRDYHIWLVNDVNDDRTRSIVVEVTPRIRPHHPAWNLKSLRAVLKDKRHVRISGWLMLDPEHPDQVGKTRRTIWEIHPIMIIEVAQDGRWVSLDDASL